MATTATPSVNGKPRKQLSDQLDRLDGIIDCLANALPEAVADASREVTRQAMREAIAAVLTDADILALIKNAFAPTAPAPAPVPAAPAPAGPGPLSRLKSAIGRALRKVADRVGSVAAKVVRPLRATASAIKAKFDAARRKCREVACAIDVGMKLRKTLLVAAGVGLAVTAAAQANHTLASVAAGVGAAVSAVAVQVGMQVRGFFRKLGDI